MFVFAGARSDQWPDDDDDDAHLAPAASFCKTQSSPDFDRRTPEPPVTFPAASQSTDELHSYARRSEATEENVEEDLGRDCPASSSSVGLCATAVDIGDDPPCPDEQQPALGNLAFFHIEASNDEIENDRDYYSDDPPRNDDDGGEVDSGNTTNAAADSADAGRSNVRGTTAADSAGGRPPRREKVVAALDGVEKAMRAPERSATGGVAYYVNLEEHHFDEFPGQLGEGPAGAFSADNYRAV